MAEYIDKAALVSEVEKNKLMAREPAARRILEIIKGMTVFVGVGLNDDVAPVRHGEWIPISDGEGAECSECGEYYDVEGNHSMESFKLFCRFYRFCPNCGAKMDGGEENEM